VDPGAAARAAARAALVAVEAARRRNVEEAQALLEVLDSAGPVAGVPPVGLAGPLVDGEGFPRSDVDHYQVRSLRHRLACLRTDRKALEAELETKLHALHQLPAAPGAAAPPAARQASAAAGATRAAASAARPPLAPQSAVGADPAACEPARALGAGPPVASGALSAPLEVARVGAEAGLPDLAPIALVDLVLDGSPAASAGLQVGDRVLRFGSVSRPVGGAPGEGGAAKLEEIARETSRHVNQRVVVEVLREAGRVELALEPRQWPGRGVLGCHLMPL
jgi:26S proteasome non-ATPase regulatory subunit 9